MCEQADPALVASIRQQLADPQTPAIFRLELGRILQVHQELDRDTSGAIARSRHPGDVAPDRLRIDPGAGERRDLAQCRHQRPEGFGPPAQSRDRPGHRRCRATPPGRRSGHRPGPTAAAGQQPPGRRHRPPPRSPGPIKATKKISNAPAIHAAPAGRYRSRKKEKGKRETSEGIHGIFSFLLSPFLLIT